jgi:hypothetical protein
MLIAPPEEVDENPSSRFHPDSESRSREEGEVGIKVFKHFAFFEQFNI